MGIWTTIKKFASNITVEPIMLLFSMSHGFYILIAQSLYIAKVCSVNLNYSREICDDIYHHPEVQIEVQKIVSMLQAYNGILQALPAIVYALFAGPWSDIHGRKTLIAWSCFGYIFNNGTYIINTVFWDQLKAEYLLFECLQDCTGGYICFFLGCYSYLSDISTKETRTKRIAFLDGLFPIGFYIGMALSGIVKKKIGFLANFGFGMGGALIAMLWTIFILKDSRKMRPPEVQEEIDRKKKQLEESEIPAKKQKGKLASLFDVRNLKKSFTTAFKKRAHGIRPYIITLIIIFVLEIFLSQGRGQTMFLYLRKEFKWDEATFGQYIAVFGIVGLFTQYVAVPFLTESCHLHDTTIGALAVIGAAVQCVITAFAKVDWVLYIAGLVAFLSPCITTTCRSMLSKNVEPLEVGAIFSVVGAMQACVPLFGSPIYGIMYKSTIETFPGTFLLFTAGAYLIVISLLIVVNLGLRKVEKRRKVAEEENLMKPKALLNDLNSKEDF